MGMSQLAVGGNNGVQEGHVEKGRGTGRTACGHATDDGCTNNATGKHSLTVELRRQSLRVLAAEHMSDSWRARGTTRGYSVITHSSPR
jgi:hypothetical protein